MPRARVGLLTLFYHFRILNCAQYDMRKIPSRPYEFVQLFPTIILPEIMSSSRQNPMMIPETFI